MSAQGIVARATSRELSPKERAVADFYVEHREEAAFLSAAEIAERLGTSDATVVRAVKAMGYTGMSELRRELIDELRARATPAVRLGRSLEDVGEDPLGYLLGIEIERLEQVRAAERADFERGVDVLGEAERVLAFGLGPTAALAEYFARRLGRFGRPVEAIGAGGLPLADRLLGLRAGDVLLLIVFESLDRDADVALARANELGLPVVLLTDTLGAKLADRIEVAVSSPRARGGAFRGGTTTVALLDALLLALAARDRSRSLASMTELNRLRKQLRGTPLQEEIS
jgi:DNA-binding MurR/RpiR family transcriptional regulator